MFHFDETVFEKMRVRDKIFRDINKVVIMSVITESTRPAEKRGYDKVREYEKGIEKGILYFVLSRFFPESIADTKKFDEERRKKPEKQRNQQLELASNILDILTHGERVQYFETASSKGLFNANKDWEHRTLTWRVVRDT